MARTIPHIGFMIPLGMISIIAAIFAYSANADSTLTIPVPEKAAKDKKITLSLRIPPNTEPITKNETPAKLSSKRSMIVWYSDPSPKLPNTDECIKIMETFNKKGWIKSYSAQAVVKMRPVDKYHAIRVLEAIVDGVLELAQSPNLTRAIRKCNLTTSDIEDLRRMIQRFSAELVMFGANPKNIDKDLLMLQERFKTARMGILKVIKVEGGEDGGTVIHLNVD